MTTFEALGLSPGILKSVHALGFEAPTPIQSEAIPLVLRGRDLMGLAQTGTGKTAAFSLPLIHHLLAEKAKPAPKAARSLILAPTRELANQIAAHLRDFVRRTPLHICSVIGGASINIQIRNLRHGTDILVATPGRLLDLVERRAVALDSAKFLVLDEADQMLDLGFIHALRKIAKLLGTPRQTLLFSATMPKQIEELSRTYLNDPVRIETATPGRAADKIRQSVHFIDRGDKAALLKKCLAERPGDLSLVFARTKHGSEKLMKQLVQSGFPAGSIHGNKSQGQRDRAIKAFRSGRIRVLVATDVAARGIDIPGVSHVYNFDLPEVPENYVHRIGRTARAGADGEAVAFCAPTDIGLLRGIERLMGIKIEVVGGEAPPEEHARSDRNGKGRPRRKNRRRNGNGGNQQRPARREDKAATAHSSDGQPKRHRRNGDDSKTGVSSEAGPTAVKHPAENRPGRKRPKHTEPANGNRPGKWRRPKRKSAA